MFSLRIVTTDHYQAKPLSDLDVKHSEFRCSSVYKVPVIRIYGSTPAGQKTCMHVHGVFPYLYVPYDGTQPWDRYLRLFASSLDKAINIAQGHQSSNIQHVYKITLVSGIPMYGYHDKEEQFLKIYLYNPGIVRKVADLLLGGAVMNQVFQPHESHIPYTLQMFIDYNLYGMNMINLAAVKFRKQHTDDNERRDGNSRENSQDSDISMPRSRPFSLDTPRNTSQRWDDDTITRDMYISATRQSTCELEVDAVAVDIINRLEVDSNVGGNPGLAALWEDEKQRQRDKGQSSQITPQDSQEREDVEITESDGDLQEKFRQIVLELQPYMDSQSDDGSQDGLDEIPPTPASQVELHQSQRDDMSTSSQDTVILDEDKDKVEPVISLESIQRVVSFSQSFHGADSLLSSQPLSDTQDGCLAQALAALADESSPPASQAAAQHVSALEEQDSILHHRSVIPDQKVEQEDEEETLEMSQMIWDEEEEKSEHGESYDLAGIDDTWNDSQIRTLNDKDDDSEEEDEIPQFDGAADDKKAEKPKSENRPGDRGPVIAGGYNQVDPTNGGGNQPYSGQGHLSYQGQMSQGQIMYGRENYTSGQSGNMSYRGYQPQQQGENYQLNQQLHMQNHQQHHQGYSNKGNEVDNNYMHRNMYRSNNQNWGQTYPNNDPQQQGTGGYDMASWGSYNAGENQDWSNQMSSPQNSMRNENVQSPTPHHHSMLHSPVENLQRMSSSPSNINSPQGILHSPTTAMHSPHSTLPSPDGRLQSPHSNMQSPQPPMQSSQSIQQSLSSPAMSNTGSRTPMASPPLPDVRGNNFEGSNSQGYPSGYQNYNFPGGACKVEYNAQSCAQNTQSGYSYGHRNIQQQYYQTQAGNQSTFNQSAYYHTSQNTYQPDKSHQKNPNAFENRSQMNFAENKSNFKKKLKAKLMEKQLNQKPLSPGHLQSPKFPGNRGIVNFPSQTTSNSNAQSSQSKPQHKPPSQLEKLLMADDDDSQTSQDVSHRSLSRCSNTSNTSSSRASEKSQVINNVPAGNGAHSSNSSLSSFSPLSEIIRGNDTVSMKDSTPDKQQSTQFSRTLCQSASGKRNSLNSDSDDLFFDNLSQPNSSNTSMFNDLFNPDNLSPPTFNAQPESIEPGVAACNLNTQVFQRGQLLSPVNQTATHQQTPHPQSQIKGSSFSSLESLENLVSSVQQNSYYGVDVQHHELGDSVGLPSQDLIRSYSKSGDISPSRQNLIDPLRQNQHQLVPIQGNALQNQQDMTSVDHRNICHTNYQHTSASHANELQSYNNWNRPGPYDCLNNEAHHTNNRQFTSNSFYENTANAHPYNWTNTSYETIHSLPPNYDSKMKAQDHMQQYPTLHTQFYQRNHNTPDPSNKNRRSVPKSSNKKSKLTRSLSLPTVPKKRGRPRKCDVNQGIVRNRSNSLVFEKKLLSYNPAYTFAFHVPSPVFKRLKFHQNHPPKDHGIKVVRMHPKDARKYSLMKVGCEIVQAEKLTQKQITGQIESLKQKLASDRDLTTKTTTMLDEKTGVMIAVEINESDDKDSEEGTTSLILDSAEPENSQRTQELQTDSSEDRPDDLSDDRQDNNTSELDTNSFSSIDRTVSKNGKSEADPSLDQISTDLPHDNNMDTHKQFLVDETVSVSLQSENVSRDSVCDQDLSQNYLEGNTSDCNLNSNITNEVQIISAKPVDLSETKHKTSGVLIDETASVSLQSENVSRDSVCDQDLSQDYLEGNTSDCNLNSNIANEAQIISAKPVDLSETKHKTSGVLIDCCLQMKVLNSDDGIAKTANERITNIDDEIKQQTKMSSERNNGTCMKEEEMVKSENSFQSCTVSKTSAELRSDPFIDKVSANFSPSKDQSCETDLYTEIRSTLLNNIMEKVKFSSNDGETKKTTDFKSIPGKSVGTEIPFTKSSTVDGNLLIKNGENGCLFSIVNKCKAERKKKRRCLSTKKRRQAVFNGHSFPPVVDPDKDELNNIVLKDVNLTEASDGKLTPIRGHTPVAGRSPIRMNYNVEQYRLFDADIISNKDDLEPNLKILHRDLCTSDNHLDKKLKNISMIEKEECSQSCGDSPVSSLISSRTSSRKDSSESTNSGSESWKERWSLRKRKSSSITSDQGSGHRKSLRQRKATLLSYDNSGSDLDCVFEKEDRVKKKKKKKEIAGIDYIVTGRFKGHQSMRVSLDRLDIDTNGIVNAPEFIASRIKQGDLTLQKPVRQYTNIMSVEKGTQDLLRKAQSRTPAFELFTKLQNEAFGDKNGNAGVDDDDDDDDDKNGNAGVDDDDDDKNGNAGVDDDDDDKNGNTGVDDDDDDDDDVGGGKDIFDVNDDVIEQDENVCEVERNVEDFDEDSNESLKDCQVDDNESDSGSWRGKLSLKKIRNKRGIRKKLTRNQKLQVAFLGKKSRRKKSLGSIGKLLNSLSLLHDATIANLNDSNTTSYNDACKTEDFKVRYDDAMLKMSFLSSSDSDRGGSSPPHPLSPEELARDHQGLTRSTSDVQSPVLSASENSLSPAHHFVPYHQKECSVSDLRLSPIYPFTVTNHKLSSGIFQDCSSDATQPPVLSNQNTAYFLSSNQKKARSSPTLPLFNLANQRKPYKYDISQIYCTQGGIDIKKAQKAVVKLKLLSLKDIELYCGKNGLKHSVGKMLNSNTTKYEISSSSENNFTINVKKCDTIHHNQYFNDRTNSPPDLGPPNIPKYPKSGGYADEPDLPPPLLTHRSPRSQRPDITSYGMFENSFSKSPASCCSSGSLNIVHSDRFSDISDDEDDDEDQGMNVIKDQGSFLGSLQPELLHNDMPALLLENCNPKSLSDSCFHLNGNKELQIDYTGPENVSTENEKNVSLNIPVNRSESAPNHNLNITDMVRDSDKSSDTTSGDGDCFNHCDKLLVSKQRILTPQILPPTCKAVQDTTAGYGLNTAVIQDAYCSNPEDLPEQPRELGGRIFKVQSTRIKDLIEFNGFGHCEGLSSWRNILNSENQIFSTQNENDILMNKLDQEPQLRFALSGDRNIIISPCKPPPTRKEVERWVKGRQLWKHFKKNKNIKTHDEKINVDKNKQELLKEKMELCNRINEDQKKSGESLTSEINDSVNKLYREDADMSVTEVTNDSFYFMDTQVDTEKEQSRFCDSIPIVKNNNDKDEMDGDSSDSNGDVISPSPPSGLRLSQFPIADRCKKVTSQGQHHVAEPTTPLAGNINTTPTATFENITTSTPALMQDIEFKSQRVQKHDNISTVTNTPSVLKRPISLSEGSFHSTPIQRKRLANLFGSAFTPIKSGEKGSADIDSAENLRTSQFAMPRQTPLPKRQSTDSGDSLRRSLQASHLRQFATPANQKGHVSQIDAPTPQNSFGFKVSQQDFKNAKALHEFQNLTVLSMELHAETRVDLRPDPEVDQILAIFYSITNDVSPDKGVRQVMGAIIVDPVSADCQFAQKERLEDSDNEIPLSDSSHLTPSPQPSTSTGQGKRSTPSKARTPSPQPSTSTSQGKRSTPSKARTPSPQPSTSTGQGKRSTPSKARTPSPQPSTSTGQGKRSTPSKARTPSPQPSTSTGQGKRSTPSKARTPSPQPSTSRASRSRTPSPKPSTSKSKKGSEEKGASPRLPVSHKFGADENIPNTVLQRSGIDCDLDVTYVREEAEVFSVFMDVVSRFDPDILVGYEVQNFSWGYLLQRASHLSMPIAAKLSRIPEEKKASHFSAEKDEYGADYASEIHVVGRIVLNLWRLLRHEVTLNIYSFENVTYHVLHQRVPHFSFRTLNMWYGHRTHLYRWRVMEYYLTRVKGNLQLIEQLDLIGRTSEFARVFGIEFYDVLSRGSQYRVESMMLRLAKPLNYIPVSPSVHQRARMRAPECIALTLEPESRFYADPVVVVDFQSLYPSIMIAHNYCFSTCLGRLKWLDKAHEGAVEFGCTHVKIPPSVLKKLQNDITVSPNGVVFVKQHIRKGVISAMVEEILNTRIMVKKAMKEHKKDKGLHRLLDARQLGLKLIANVTYGYTGANYSGRMPCIEVGDSIVRKARETLERAIKLVEDTPHWGARVVYGDTDSMFIELKGRSKEEAFKIGYEICDAVTATNPKPMKLKFEKVYLPCILQTKKRYVGFSYETPDQKDPIFDAKGIETVRRDSCSAVSKILEKCIKILFTTRDVSRVKQYVQNQCRKTMEGKVTMQDFIFAKEYRGMSGYKPGACVPALEISRKLLRQDRRAEPRVGERVPYVIVFGPPGLPLIQLVRQPQELLQDPSLRLNATYYITKQILPPLDRIFSLMGVNVFSWYNDMPKFVRVVPQSAIAPESKKGTISHYFSASNCPVCDQQTNQDICNKCMKDPQTVCATLTNRIRHWDKIYMDLKQVCNSCMGVQDNNQPCVSLDCPILFRRLVGKLDTSKGAQLQEILKKTFDV